MVRFEAALGGGRFYAVDCGSGRAAGWRGASEVSIIGPMLAPHAGKL